MKRGLQAVWGCERQGLCEGLLEPTPPKREQNNQLLSRGDGHWAGVQSRPPVGGKTAVPKRQHQPRQSCWPVRVQPMSWGLLSAPVSQNPVHVSGLSRAIWGSGQARTNALLGHVYC